MVYFFGRDQSNFCAKYKWDSEEKNKFSALLTFFNVNAITEIDDSQHHLLISCFVRVSESYLAFWFL